jgi:hypothetical protein
MLIPLSVMFTLSLVGSIILFRFLKSSATIKKKSYQAGGAIAGFILIYGLLFTSFNSMNNSERLKTPDKWTIKGKVLLQDANTHEGITVKHIPETPEILSKKNGEFRLENVAVFPNQFPNGLPELYFNSGRENYHELPIDLSTEDVEINEDKKQITLKKALELTKIELGGE